MSAPADASQRKGPVIAVVGPSGVGKDSLMQGLAVADPRLRAMRRVITRAPEAGGEDYQPVTEAEFEALATAGVFALHWRAHGLRYGIPRDIEALRIGASGVLVNLSRAVLLQAQEVFDDFRVISVTATPEVLAARLAARGREDAAEVQRRLSRASLALPEGLAQLFEVDNSGALGKAVAAAQAIIQAERA
ncbi:phosphonate metabolism protein/1,5-bisphosphokinase (PRPP-forming) PhnN [Phaeobacter sp. HF9A]|uniref:phosphonate metabolism protein/1,5-bisphosphokinase (PRPP-forming) PhnN n=1 Tax=Phaeobacter sp. HF9A TaxID=2721561 RepID=UPI0014319163|nr:phosphonate metabolism protein/1,5-bisphosphokinase (PRPP-forming) PhnN [Phaeobacter sp. HF9A]NIZ15281.1 phosphonate metabolism protein/1,5-bisphosphokinase (PRPP-forming) PhnN [Phaeobacter sp. HF9A]